MRLKPAQNTARLNVIKCNVVVRPPNSKILACKQATTMIKGKARSISIFKQSLYALRCIAREWIFLISIPFIPPFNTCTYSRVAHSSIRAYLAWRTLTHHCHLPHFLRPRPPASDLSRSGHTCFHCIEHARADSTKKK